MELAGGCNYSCEMCPQSSGREKEFNKLLKWETFVKIVDNAIFENLKIKLVSKKKYFFEVKQKKSQKALNHEDIVVAIGIIINPILLKK